jgi:hypothetical protein
MMAAHSVNLDERRQNMGTRDFTSMLIGTKIDNGDIQVCPYCNRRGLCEVVNGMSFYLHSETIEVDPSAPVVKYDMCPTSTRVDAHT